MLLYHFDLQYEEITDIPVSEDSEAKQSASTAFRKNKDNRDAFRNINMDMGKEIAEEGQSIFVYQIDHNAQKISMILAHNREQRFEDFSKVEERIKTIFDNKISGIRSIFITNLREITCSDFCECVKLGYKEDLIRAHWSILNYFSMEYFENKNSTVHKQYRIEEKIVSAIPKKINNAIHQAENIMAHQSLRDELDRIYDVQNSNEFWGHPVHYIIQADRQEAAQEMIDLLVSALYARNRLKSKRIFSFYNFVPHDSKISFWNSIVSLAQQSTMVLYMSEGMDTKRGKSGHFKHAFHEDYINNLVSEIKQHRNDTLFILVVPAKKELDATRCFIESLNGAIDFVTLSEGVGGEKQAKKYINYLAMSRGQRKFTAKELKNVFTAGKTYSVTEAWEAYEKATDELIRWEHYPAYRRIKAAENTIEEKVENNSYEQLQQLIGLKEVKKLVDRILAVHQIQAIQKKKGIELKKPALHMVFTGNPGTAKTTVARLLAGILKERNILSTGAFVECGRADLIGKFVGHTAPIVIKKFDEAEGGILFIDEAYSLVDERQGLYGDEAINTIVQEMENRRENVLVIFAGYPQPMKSFIERNVGLRSRIAFHLDFSDYDANELCRILECMAEEQGYRLDEESMDYCRELFQKASDKKDFGNGRFVRNVLEAAVLSHAEYLVNSYSAENIDRQMIQNLTINDFKNEFFGSEPAEKHQIGFCMM